MELPKNYNYFKVSDDVYRIKEITDRESSDVWLKEYSRLTKSTWRVLRTYPYSSLFNVFKIDFRCCHFTDRRIQGARSSKHTGCKATIKITVKKLLKKSKNPDPLTKQYPCIVRFDIKHNHDLDSAAILRYRDLCPTVKDKFYSLFRNGHTIASALASYKEDLMMKMGERYSEIAADGKYMPTYSEVSKLYQKEKAREEIIYYIAEGKSPHEDWQLPLDYEYDVQFSEQQVPLIAESFKFNNLNGTQSSTSACSQQLDSNMQSILNEDFEQIDESTYVDKIKSDTISELKCIFQRIEENIHSNTFVFLPAAEAMVKNYNKFASTDLGLFTSMYTFGLYSGNESSPKKQKVKKLSECHESVGGVQPCPISKRKISLSGEQGIEPESSALEEICGNLDQ